MVHVLATCSTIRPFTGDVTTFDVDAPSLWRMIAELDARYPGLGEHIRRRMAVAIDGEIHQSAGDVPLTPASEVVLIPRIGGG